MKAEEVETILDCMTTVNKLQCAGQNLLNVNDGEKYCPVNSENGTGNELNDPVDQFADHLLEEDPDDVDMRPPYCMSSDSLNAFMRDVKDTEPGDDYYDLNTFVKSLVPGLRGIIDNAITIAAFHKLKEPKNLNSFYLPCGNDQCWGAATLKFNVTKQIPKLPVLRNPSVYEEPVAANVTREAAREYLSKLEEAIKSETGKVCGVCCVYSYFGTDKDENNRNIGWAAFPAVHDLFFRAYTTHNLPFGDIFNQLTITNYYDSYCLLLNGKKYI